MICSVDGCDKEVKARKMCQSHYRRARKYEQGGYRYIDLGVEYGVSKDTIADILCERTWSWIEKREEG